MGGRPGKIRRGKTNENTELTRQKLQYKQIDKIEEKKNVQDKHKIASSLRQELEVRATSS